MKNLQFSDYNGTDLNGRVVISGDSETTSNSLGSLQEADAASEAAANLYEVPTFVVVILSLFYGIISLTAFVGNSLVIYVVIVSRRMRTVTNMYIANLAFADVTIAVFAIPFQFHAALLQVLMQLIATLMVKMKLHSNFIFIALGLAGLYVPILPHGADFVC